MTHLNRKILTSVSAASALVDTSHSIAVTGSANGAANLILSPRALEFAALYERITSEEIKAKVFDVVLHISASELA